MIACTQCGAHNPPNAVFCSQCYVRFDADTPEDQPAVAPAQSSPASSGSPLPDPSPASASATMPPAQQGDSPIFLVEGKAMWQCAVCELVQSVESFVCTQCHNRFGQRVITPEQEAEWVRLERYFPGLGYIRSDHAGMGYSRALLAITWILIGLVIAKSVPSAGIPLIIGLAILWVMGPRDLPRVLRGGAPMLSGRWLLALVIAVLGVTMFTALGVSISTFKGSLPQQPGRIGEPTEFTDV